MLRVQLTGARDLRQGVGQLQRLRQAVGTAQQAGVQQHTTDHATSHGIDEMIRHFSYALSSDQNIVNTPMRTLL